ncbi:hypothetical protein PsorP6_008041 [Peronosclerospora sorghi]|uniref:Uncharacterized protein n=1 Tax=Peronosclerospora sorghi TaxID=230839 RepID=A0ACC0WC70_9STRA|nr:hypothetical protein PsorP6_008041 [Peronosclerospora sorghi]
MAFNAERNFRFSEVGPEPMDLSQVEAEEKPPARSHSDSTSQSFESELLAMLQRHGPLRCFLCGSTDHLRNRCPKNPQRDSRWKGPRVGRKPLPKPSGNNGSQ